MTEKEKPAENCKLSTGQSDKSLFNSLNPITMPIEAATKIPFIFTVAWPDCARAVSLRTLGPAGGCLLNQVAQQARGEVSQ